jgi:hypothetical protein
LVATAALQRTHPGLFIGELGFARTNKAVNKLVGDDFRKAEATSVPITLCILVIAGLGHDCRREATRHPAAAEVAPSDAPIASRR